jgi:hypothetical protein
MADRCRVVFWATCGVGCVAVGVATVVATNHRSTWWLIRTWLTGIGINYNPWCTPWRIAVA